MPLTETGRKMNANGMLALENGLAQLQEWAASLPEEEVARRLETSAAMLSMFTGCSTFTSISITWRTKFGKNWRELLSIAAAMFARMKRWYDAGYPVIIFQHGNTGCKPAQDYTATGTFIGTWTALERMISVYCRGGVIEEPPEENQS